MIGFDSTQPALGHSPAPPHDELPLLMRDALLSYPPSRPGSGVLDLGCGSGAMAAACHDLPLGAWTGVDTCPAMLGQARLTGHYHTISERDLPAFLAEDTHSYSVVLCHGAVGQFAELVPFCAAVLQRLIKGGIFVFATDELPPGPQAVRRGAMGQHAYTAATLADAVERAGFAVEASGPQALRKVGNYPVIGRLTTLRRPASSRGFGQ